MQQLSVDFKILLLLLSLLLLISCNNDNPVSQDIVSPQYQANNINIGYLSGSPVHLRNSALLAMSHINQAGGILGKELNVIVLQSTSAQVATDKAIDLMDNFAVEVMMVTSSSRTLAVAEVAIPRQVVVLSATATSPALSDVDDDDYLFRTAPSDVYQGRMLAELAYTHGARRAVMVINHQDVYGTGLAQQYMAEFSRLGGSLNKIVTVPHGQTADFGEYIDNVHSENPDAIILALLGGIDNAQFINESVNHGFEGMYLFPDTTVGDNFTSNLASPDVIEQAFGVSPSFSLPSNPEFVAFAQAYLATFGITQQQFDANVYDAIMIAALAMAHAGYVHGTDSPTGTMTRDSMRAVMNPPGQLLGPSQIDLALSMVNSGADIDYTGAYSQVDFDSHGDLSGALVYDIYQYNNQNGQLEVAQQLIINVSDPSN